MCEVGFQDCAATSYCENMSLCVRSSASLRAHPGALVSCKPVFVRVARRNESQPRTLLCRISETDTETKTVVMKVGEAEMPFPWSDKDPYRLPVTIERVQKYLMGVGWEKAWVEQIVDRVMKNMLRTTEERAKSVVEYLLSLGLRQDEICNMASISVVLLGLNPETRMKAVVEYLKKRGVPDGGIPDLVLKHPRIFEYKVSEDGVTLYKNKARIQVDVLPIPSGEKVVGVNYYREGASFLEAPVSPVTPLPN